MISIDIDFILRWHFMCVELMIWLELRHNEHYEKLKIYKF
jgi:hypothetical protein